MTQTSYQNIGVLGAGAWGTALACAAARAGRNVIIWAREADVVHSINTQHENSLFLKDIPLDPALKATKDLNDFSSVDALLLVSPAQHLRTSVKQVKNIIKADCPLIICSKGIEVTTGQLMSQVITDIIPKQPLAVLSGPTFASEVAKGEFSAITLACDDENMGEKLVQALGTPTFRPYYSPDVIGSQIGGAVKNVLAIATGIAYGLKMGDNTRAAVITRGLAEMGRFAASYGAENETLMGLSGLGDLLLTCSSIQSRNMSLGKALGEGQTFTDYMQGRLSVAEGAHTVEILQKIADEKKINMPITNAVYKVIIKGDPVSQVFQDLMNRPFTREGD